MTTVTLDAPDAVCYFQSHDCSHLVSGRGGFDLHHPVPVELGGAEDEQRITVCALHHRRQHALIRYLVECEVASLTPAWDVLCHFTGAERNVATHAVDTWVALGLPVPQWNVPAARA